jgi:hypothetical protein
VHEVDVVLCGIPLQVLELRNSYVLERLPVKFATTFEQDNFYFFIAVLTTWKAI